MNPRAAATKPSFSSGRLPAVSTVHRWYRRSNKRRSSIGRNHVVSALGSSLGLAVPRRYKPSPRARAKHRARRFALHAGKGFCRRENVHGWLRIKK